MDNPVVALAGAVERLTLIVQQLVKEQAVLAQGMLDLGKDHERIRERLDSLEQTRDNDSRIRRGDGD